MASNFKLATTGRNAGIAAIGALVDDGTIEIWEAVAGNNPPATPATSISDDDTNYKLLAVLSLADPAFGSPSTGVITADTIGSDTNVNKSGTAEFFRVKNDGGGVEYQGTAGEAGDTPDCVFDNKTLVAGGTAAISSFTLTQPVGGS